MSVWLLVLILSGGWSYTVGYFDNMADCLWAKERLHDVKVEVECRETEKLDINVIIGAR